MPSLSCRLFAVILLATASLAFGAPVSLNSSPEQNQSAMADSEHSEGSGDGFQRTVQAFEARVNKARGLIEFLQKTNVEAKSRIPDNPAKVQAYFLMKLGEVYPGSTYDGNKGKLLFQQNLAATFNNTMNVESITELGEVSATYLLHPTEIIITFGTNSVTAIIDCANPSRSRFTAVTIPAMRVDAEKILSIAGYKRVTGDSVESSIINDAYQLLSQTNALRMDYFAADIMRSGKLQKKALSIAAGGYFERHPQEYQKGVEAASSTSKVTDGTERLTLSKGARFLGILFLMVLLSYGFFRGARRIITSLQMIFQDDSSRKYAKRYRSLSLMVVQALRQVGRSLWGRNFPWSRKFYVMRRSDRWVLSDGKIDRYDLYSHPDNLLEVCLRNDNFKIRITRLGGNNVDMAVTSRGYSKQELMALLRELTRAFSREETFLPDPPAPPAGEGTKSI